MCNQYPQRVKERIIPLSVSSDIRQAINEWRFTDRVHDNGYAEEVCEFCGQESIRYQYEIENTNNRNRIWVGSSCILKFDVPVILNGRRLDPTAAKTRLDNLAYDMRRQACITALERLAASESSPALGSALEQYKKRRTLTPKQIALILWRLQHNKIDHHANFFTVDLTKQRYKDDLKAMATWKVHQIWPALTSNQRKIAERLGHPPPSRK